MENELDAEAGTTPITMSQPSKETIDTTTTSTSDENPMLPVDDAIPRHLTMNASRTSKGRMVGTRFFEPRIQTRGLGDRQYAEDEVTAEMSPVAALTANKMASARSSPTGYRSTSRASAHSSPRERLRTPASGTATTPRSHRRQSQQSQFSRDGPMFSPASRGSVSDMQSPMSVSKGHLGSGGNLIPAYLSKRSAQKDPFAFERTRSHGTQSYGEEILTAVEMNTLRGKIMSGIPDDDAALDEYFKNMSYTTARAQGYLDKPPLKRTARAPKTAAGYSWLSPRIPETTSDAPMTLVARVVETSRSLDLQRGSTEEKSDFHTFKRKVHEHHAWLSESMKRHKFGVLVTYDASIAGSETPSESILLRIFRFYCGRQGIMGGGVTFDKIENSHNVMVMAEFIKLIREMVPCAQVTTQELTWIIHRTKMLPVPVLWQTREWGPPPADTTGYKITFAEFLCALIRVAVLCFPGDEGDDVFKFHMDAVKNMAVELELERGMLNFKAKIIAIGRSSGGFSGWVDSSFAGPRPSDQIPEWGRRREESAGAALEALDHDANLMGSLCDALIKLGKSSGDTPWAPFEGCFLAMVLPTTGAPLPGRDPTLSDGAPPHKFQVLARNSSPRNQHFFLRLENLPMFTQVKKPRAASFDEYAPDQNAAAPGHSLAFLLYAFTNKVGIVQGEIVLSNTEGGPALYSIPVFLKVIRAPQVKDEARPEPTPRIVLSRHIREKGLVPVKTRIMSQLHNIRTPQLTPRAPNTAPGDNASSSLSPRHPIPEPPRTSPPSRPKPNVPALDLSHASLSRPLAHGEALRSATAKTERTTAGGRRDDTTTPRPKTTRVDVSGGVKLSRQGAANHAHTPHYLTHGRCSSGYFPMASTSRPQLHIDMLSGGILRTVNLHERFG